MYTVSKVPLLKGRAKQRSRKIGRKKYLPGVEGCPACDSLAVAYFYGPVTNSAALFVKVRVRCRSREERELGDRVHYRLLCCEGGTW